MIVKKPQTPQTSDPSDSNSVQPEASEGYRPVSGTSPPNSLHTDFSKTPSDPSDPSVKLCHKAQGIKKGMEDLRAESGRMHRSGTRLGKMAWESRAALNHHTSTCLVCQGGAA
jgi:hypothetical protein